MNWSWWYIPFIFILIVLSGIIAYFFGRGRVRAGRGNNQSATTSSRGWLRLSQTQRGYISAAFPVIAMWGVALYALKTLFPSTWNAWSNDGLWIATALVMIYALSRTWTTKADRFAVILFAVAAIMVIVHETQVLPTAAKEMQLDLSWMGFGSQNGPHTTEYSIAPGEGPVPVTMPFGKSTTLHCTGDLRFVTSWTDDGGRKERTGTCRDLNAGKGFSGAEGSLWYISVMVRGGESGGTVIATVADP